MVRKYSLMAGVAAVVFAAPAFAGDFPSKSMPVTAAPDPSWTGFYIGVNGGYGWGKDGFDSPLDLSTTITSPSPPTAISGLSAKGTLFGGHAGYNWQGGRWVGGLEADLDWANIRGTANRFADTFDGITFIQGNSTKFDALGTLRARLGLLVTPDLLVYGTGGGAAGHTTSSATFGNNLFPIFESFTAGQTQFGWSAGAGVEGKLTALGLSNLTLRVEYLHYGFLTASTPFVTGGNGIAFSPFSSLSGFTLNHQMNVDVVRAGLTWQFTSAPGRY
jgi:outer membrane immunogenic protein